MGSKNGVNEVGRVEQTERIFESSWDVVKAILVAAFIVYLAVFVGSELGAWSSLVFAIATFVAIMIENILMSTRPPLGIRDGFSRKAHRPFYVFLFSLYAGFAIVFLIEALIVSSR